ncbi:MAG: hypothetical protein JXR23_03140 [Pontiellaceae bacterium]|nr:hypothetical protein [Pontiellaceae bacterium]
MDKPCDLSAALKQLTDDALKLENPPLAAADLTARDRNLLTQRKKEKD